VSSDKVTLGEEEIDKYDVVSDITDGAVAVGGSPSNGVIFGDEEKEKRDETTDNNDDRLILWIKFNGEDLEGVTTIK